MLRACKVTLALMISFVSSYLGLIIYRCSYHKVLLCSSCLWLLQLWGTIKAFAKSWRIGLRISKLIVKILRKRCVSLVLKDIIILKFTSSSILSYKRAFIICARSIYRPFARDFFSSMSYYWLRSTYQQSLLIQHRHVSNGPSALIITLPSLLLFKFLALLVKGWDTHFKHFVLVFKLMVKFCLLFL